MSTLKHKAGRVHVISITHSTSSCASVWCLLPPGPETALVQHRMDTAGKLAPAAHQLLGEEAGRVWVLNAGRKLVQKPQMGVWW